MSRARLGGGEGGRAGRWLWQRAVLEGGGRDGVFVGGGGDSPVAEVDGWGVGNTVAAGTAAEAACAEGVAVRCFQRHWQQSGSEGRHPHGVDNG